MADWVAMSRRPPDLQATVLLRGALRIPDLHHGSPLEKHEFLLRVVTSVRTHTVCRQICRQILREKDLISLHTFGMS